MIKMYNVHYYNRNIVDLALVFNARSDSVSEV